MLSKASCRLYILRVFKYYSYSLQELTLLFSSLIMLLFTYAIEVWVCAHYDKYLSSNCKFWKWALHYGYTSKYTPLADVIKIKDRLLWDKTTTDCTHSLHELLPPQRTKSLRKRVHFMMFITEHHKRCFVNKMLFLNFM